MVNLRQQDGFTLIELLVVVLVIGILAAIALPAFLGHKRKADDVTAKSQVRSLIGMANRCHLEKDDFRLCDSAAELDGADGMSFGTASGDVGFYGVTKDGYNAYAQSKSKLSSGSPVSFLVGHTTTSADVRWCNAEAANPGGCNGGRW